MWCPWGWCFSGLVLFCFVFFPTIKLPVFSRVKEGWFFEFVEWRWGGPTISEFQTISLCASLYPSPFSMVLSISKPGPFWGYAGWIGLLAISVPSFATPLSCLPFLLLFSIFIYSDLGLQVSPRFFKDYFLFSFLLSRRELKTIKFILHTSNSSNTKLLIVLQHTRPFHICEP